MDPDPGGLLVAELGADAFQMLTDVDAVCTGWGTPAQHAIGDIPPDESDRMEFAAGSMGPRVEAACTFVRRTGGMAGAESLQDAERILAGKAGTRVTIAADRLR